MIIAVDSKFFIGLISKQDCHELYWYLYGRKKVGDNLCFCHLPSKFNLELSNEIYGLDGTGWCYLQLVSFDRRQV